MINDIDKNTFKNYIKHGNLIKKQLKWIDKLETNFFKNKNIK